MGQEINYPNPPLYYISYNINAQGNKQPNSYGFIASTQCMKNNYIHIDTFTDKQDWIDALAVEGISIEEEL